jgi:hypothetical protein
VLRMPAYEMAHVKDPEHALFDHIRVSSGFETGRRLDGECHADPESSTYICAANYEFAGNIERLGVECTFFDVTVTNHIHMLHAERDGKFDQAILDSSFPSATLAFRPPTRAEIAVEQSGAGALRVWTNYVQLLLLIALAIAARNRRELAALAVAFLAGECAATLAIGRFAWHPSPRFAEAAAALALSYLALEILVFPKSGGRWLLALVFGGFAGMYFSIFVGESGYQARYVLAGAGLASLLVVLVAATFRSRLPGRYQLVSAPVLLIAGAVWFFVRLRG